MYRKFLPVTFLTVAIIMSVAFRGSAETLSTSPGRPLPDILAGLTVEEVTQLDDLREAIAAHSRRPVVRIVFQAGTDPETYRAVITQLRPHAYIMGEILDSTAVKALSVEQVRQRTRDFVGAFGNQIDIWEIGNELNGEWLGEPEEIYAKTLAAWRVVEKEHAAENLRSAITLNFWSSHDCYAKPWEDTRRFAKGMPEELKLGTDFLLLSFYETACKPRAYPSVDDFADILSDLGAIFPEAALGIGEVGAQGLADGLANDPGFEEKRRIATQYYAMAGGLRERLGDRFIGGFFWWYYSQDSVPMNKPQSMWPSIEALLLQMPK